MTRWIEHTAIVLAAIACALLFIRLLSFRTPARAALCRGPSRPLFLALLPWSWFYSHRCDYDLSGSVPDAAGQVTCPECGTRQVRSTRLRRPTRWRTERIALVLLVIALPCWKIRWIRSGNWAPYTPTPALLAVEHTVGSLMPGSVREQLRARAKTMNSVWRTWLCRIAIGELRDDHVPFNGDWAMDVLTMSAPQSLPMLERSLGSADLQQRQAAAMVLMRLIDGNPRPWNDTRLTRLPPEYTPPHRLIEVAVEGLAADRVRWDAGFFATNHLMAFRYLIRHASDATRELEVALSSDDPQQQLLSSAVVAISRHPELAPRGATILLACLSDDAEESNAIFAYQALYRMGDAAIPVLENAIMAEPDQESQRARAALLLVYRLRGTPITDAESRHLNRISQYNDPLHARDSWLLRMIPPLAMADD